MDVYGPSRAGRYVSFLKLFPNMFDIQGSGGNIRVFVKATAAPPSSTLYSELQKSLPEGRQIDEVTLGELARFEGATQVGGASSSTEPARIPRTPRAPEVDPRAPYRRFPNELKIKYSDRNPARRGTPRHARYENYKTAKTVGAARALGATSGDLSADIEKGALTIL